MAKRKEPTRFDSDDDSKEDRPKGEVYSYSDVAPLIKKQKKKPWTLADVRKGTKESKNGFYTKDVRIRIIRWPLMMPYNGFVTSTCVFPRCNSYTKPNRKGKFKCNKGHLEETCQMNSKIDHFLISDEEGTVAEASLKGPFLHKVFGITTKDLLTFTIKDLDAQQRNIDEASPEAFKFQAYVTGWMDKKGDRSVRYSIKNLSEDEDSSNGSSDEEESSPPAGESGVVVVMKKDENEKKHKEIAKISV